MRILFLSFILLFLSCAEENASSEIVRSGQAFGTTYVVKYFGKPSEAVAIQKGIDSVVYKVNKSMSTYIPASDISRMNNGDSTVVVDQMFVDVFTLSRKLNKATSGYFDPTVGTLRNAYGFGDTKPIRSLDSTKLDSLMKYVGWNKIALNEDNTITKESPEIYFDFNAIAKGYGVDRVAVYLKSKGFENFLIDIGGEIVAQGMNKETQSEWIVGIESVDSNIEKRTAIASVRLTNKAMAGSGNYRKNRIDKITGKIYVHTINPLTGSAEQSDILSATIIAGDCATADAWATACMAMGLERSKKALLNQSVEAYLVYDGGVYKTENFKLLND